MGRKEKSADLRSFGIIESSMINSAVVWIIALIGNVLQKKISISSVSLLSGIAAIDKTCHLSTLNVTKITEELSYSILF